MMNGFTVDRIPFSECKEWLLYKHYAHRIPSISYAFGLFENGILKGVCTFGSTVSHTLNIGICGNSYSDYVIELNRLIVESNKKNITSFFVSQCLKKIASPKIVVSFADSSQNHNGYIYQACNFIYTGLSLKRKRWAFIGNDTNHNHRAITQKMNYDEIRKEYDGVMEYIESSRKHRYIYFIGNKREKKQFLKALKYKIEPYPKGQNVNYDASYQPTIQGVLF